MGKMQCVLIGHTKYMYMTVIIMEIHGQQIYYNYINPLLTVRIS